jgi:hypothetical protein
MDSVVRALNSAIISNIHTINSKSYNKFLAALVSLGITFKQLNPVAQTALLVPMLRDSSLLEELTFIVNDIVPILSSLSAMDIKLFADTCFNQDLNQALDIVVNRFLGKIISEPSPTSGHELASVVSSLGKIGLEFNKFSSGTRFLLQKCIINCSAFLNAKDIPMLLLGIADMKFPNDNWHDGVLQSTVSDRIYEFNATNIPRLLLGCILGFEVGGGLLRRKDYDLLVSSSHDWVPQISNDGFLPLIHALFIYSQRSEDPGVHSQETSGPFIDRNTIFVYENSRYLQSRMTMVQSYSRENKILVDCSLNKEFSDDHYRALSTMKHMLSLDTFDCVKFLRLLGFFNISVRSFSALPLVLEEEFINYVNERLVDACDHKDYSLLKTYLESLASIRGGSEMLLMSVRREVLKCLCYATEEEIHVNNLGSILALLQVSIPDDEVDIERLVSFIRGVLKSDPGPYKYRALVGSALWISDLPVKAKEEILPLLLKACYDVNLGMYVISHVYY